MGEAVGAAGSRAGGDFVEVAEAVAIEVGGVEIGGGLVGADEAIENLVCGTADDVTDFFVVTGFDGGKPIPFDERIAWIGDLDKVAAPGVAIPAVEHYARDGDEF